MSYIRLLRHKVYIGVFIVLMCACLGSLRGAWKESREPYHTDISQEDIAGMGQPKGSVPDLIGVIPLAAEQNRWYNFSYAIHYAGRGFVLYCVVMAIYLPLYSLRFFSALRMFLKRSAGECQLWIKSD